MTLPEGLKWLQPGWWLVHLLSAALVYWYGYHKGQADLRKEMRRRAAMGETRSRT